MTDQEVSTVIITEEEPKSTSPWLIVGIVALVVLCCCCVGLLISLFLAGGLVADIFNNIFDYQFGFYY